MDRSPHPSRYGTMFAEDFDQPERAAAPVEPVFSADEMADARTSAWREGHDAGLLEAAEADAVSTKETMALRSAAG